ncbi:MAG: hypothetical protein KF914_07810 [Rhizobiaceae bacterium]|nr:hypothetical protein [Rhizobiaceae bacterium]
MRAYFRRPAPAAAIALAVLVAAPTNMLAQGLDDPASADRIVGSEIQEEQSSVATDAEKVLNAIDKTPDNIAAVRMTSALDTVDIVFLPDAAMAEGGPPAPIRDRIEKRQADVDALRAEIEGNAMIYHAINARQILPRDVLAVEFPGEREIVIYAAAKPPAD